MMSKDLAAGLERASPSRTARFFSGVLLTASGLMLLVSVAELDKTHVPGAPVALVYVAVAALLLATTLNVPPVFHCLPERARYLAYLAPLVAIVMFAVETSQMRPVWEATPQGAKEAADRVAAAAERTAERTRADADQRGRDATARSLAELEETKEQLEAIRTKLEACFTTFGHRLPALENPVKESMHNPDAFEHVDTELIVPDAQRNNVQMTFRAENAFGAIRTARVIAQLAADDCSVQNIGKPETE